MASQWYLVQGNNDLGPMTTGELKRLAAEGKIGPRDLVRKEGGSRWVLASAVDGLLSARVEKPADTPAPSTALTPIEPLPVSDLAPPPPAASAPEPQPVAAAAATKRNRFPWVFVGAGSAVLILVIAVTASWMAEPTGFQVIEVANHQPSNPPIAKPAPRPAATGPATKKAAPAGKNQVAKNQAVKKKPAPAKAPAPPVAAPPPQVAASPSFPPSADYIRLALLISNMHRGDQRDSWVLGVNPRAPQMGMQLMPRNSGPAWVVGIDAAPSNLTDPAPWIPDSTMNPTTDHNGIPPRNQLVAAIPKLKGVSDPIAKQAVARLEAGYQAAIDAFKEAEALDKRVSVARRDFEEAMRTREVTERDFEGRIEHRTENVHDEFDRFLAGLNVLATQGHVKGKIAEGLAAMENARLDCWNILVPRLPEVYRKSPPGDNLIRFRLTAPDPAGKKTKGEFAVANISGRNLTNVTLVVDLLHFATAPETTVFQVYFVPEWEAGHEIRLPMAVEQNRHCAAMKHRPVNADPIRQTGSGGAPSAADQWLAGLGGLVAVRASVWSSEANQPVRDFPFPDQALAGARWELGVALRIARNLLPGTIRRAPRNTKVLLPPDFWEVHTAQRVLTFVPPDSELARLATLLIEDPAQLLRDNRTAGPAAPGSPDGSVGPGSGSPGIDALVAVLAPGKVFQGTWHFRMPNGPPMRNGDLTVERRKKLAGLTHKNSPFTFRINTFDPKTLAVTATLRGTGPSGASRDFTGKIVEDRGTGRAKIYFPPAKPPDKRRELLVDTDFDLFTAPEALSMEREGDGLAGKMLGPIRPDIFWFELKCH